MVPPFHESLEHALQKAYGADAPHPDTRRLLRFGSWVGGDMDGNPFVNGETLLQSLRTQREAIIRCYLPEVRRLGRYLSQTRGMAEFDPELDPRLARYRDLMPNADKRIPNRHREMPYRCFLHFVAEKLTNTALDRPPAYTSPAEFQADIDLVARSLEEGKGRHAGLFGVRRLQRKIETFGFHLATLDTRQDALLLRTDLGEILDAGGWLDRPVEERIGALADHLSRPNLESPCGPDQCRPRPQHTACLWRHRRGARTLWPGGNRPVHHQHDPGRRRCADRHGPARFGGLGDGLTVPLDVAPLLETVDDLDAGPQILDRLLSLEVYREHLQRRGNRQVIMVGYSDSSKDSGIMAARWGLYEAQRQLVALGQAPRGARCCFFTAAVVPSAGVAATWLMASKAHHPAVSRVTCGLLNRAK